MDNRTLSICRGERGEAVSLDFADDGPCCVSDPLLRSLFPLVRHSRPRRQKGDERQGETKNGGRLERGAGNLCRGDPIFPPGQQPLVRTHVRPEVRGTGRMHGKNQIGGLGHPFVLFKAVQHVVRGFEHTAAFAEPLHALFLGLRGHKASVSHLPPPPDATFIICHSATHTQARRRRHVLLKDKKRIKMKPGTPWLLLLLLLLLPALVVTTGNVIVRGCWRQSTGGLMRLLVRVYLELQCKHVVRRACGTLYAARFSPVVFGCASRFDPLCAPADRDEPSIPRLFWRVNRSSRAKGKRQNGAPLKVMHDMVLCDQCTIGTFLRRRPHSQP